MDGRRYNKNSRWAKDGEAAEKWVYDFLVGSGLSVLRLQVGENVKTPSEGCRVGDLVITTKDGRKIHLDVKNGRWISKDQ